MKCEQCSEIEDKLKSIVSKGEEKMTIMQLVDQVITESKQKDQKLAALSDS